MTINKILWTIFFVCLLLVFISIWVSELSWGDEIDDLIPFIIQVESSGNPNAISKDNCRGLMQISEIVFDEYQKCLPPPPPSDYPAGYWNFDNMFNPYSNKQVGTWYLRRLKEHYLKSDYTIERMLASYNGGITRLRRLLREGKDWQDMPRESINYVRKVLKLYKEKL